MLRINKPAQLLLIMLILSLTACGNHDKSEINAVLDARDHAVSTHDIKAYQSLLLPGYSDRLMDESALIMRMRNLFKHFDIIRMTSNNRTIRLQNDGHAQCEESYHLRVQSDGAWRQKYQREQISLTRTKNGWKISGGL